MRTKRPDFLAIFQKLLSYRLTFMIVPHGAARPKQINIHLFVIALGVLTWTGITFWGSYLSAQHVDYWRTQLSNQVLKMKIQYLTGQLDKSRSYLDEVKAVDNQLRALLNYKDEATLIKEDKPEGNQRGTGGPAPLDQANLARLLTNIPSDISWNQLINQVQKLKSEARERIVSYQEVTSWIEMRRRLYRATPIGWPCRGHLTSRYGHRNSPFGGADEFHPGVDISAPLGTPIRATADGTVRLAGWNSGYGNLVVLFHEFGFSTRYAHNSRILVRVGDKVKRGQVLALMGATGKSSGVHSHYEVWQNAQRKNPMPYMSADFQAQKKLALLSTGKSSSKD